MTFYEIIGIEGEREYWKNGGRYGLNEKRNFRYYRLCISKFFINQIKNSYKVI